MDLKKEREQLHIIETLISKGQEAAALNIIEKTESQFPNSFQMKFNKAKVFMALNKNIGAEEILKELEKNHSDNLNLLKVFSDFYEKIDKSEESLVYLNKILFIDPFNTAIKEKINSLKIKIERKKSSVADTLPESKFKELMDGQELSEHNGSNDMSPEEEITIKDVDDILSQEDINIKNNVDIIPEKEESLEEEDEDPEGEFYTVSAADVYINQGLFKDALVILENIYKKNKDEEIFSKIQNLKKKIKITKKIEKLTSFLAILKNEGS